MSEKCNIYRIELQHDEKEREKIWIVERIKIGGVSTRKRLCHKMELTDQTSLTEIGNSTYISHENDVILLTDSY